MKIIQLIQKPQKRGAELFASQLSSHLTALGHEVILVSLFKGDSELPFAGQQVHLGLSPRTKLFDWKGFQALSRLIKKEKPDIIQANAGDTLKYAVLSQLLFHWQAPIVCRNASVVSAYIKNPLIKYFNAFLYRQVAQVISVSEASKKDLNLLFPATQKKSQVIPIGIELQDLKESNEKLAFAPNQIHVLHVGGFSFEKNHISLLSIFQALLKQIPSVHLHLVGDGVLKTAIEGKVKDLNLIEKVTFHGYQTDPLQFMQQAAVLVLPSLIEGLPGVILEAQYAQCPVIAYDVGGISEVIQDGKTGYLVEKGDALAFVEKVNQVLEHPTEVDAIKSAAHQQVIERFDNRAIAQAFAQVYLKLAAC